MAFPLENAPEVGAGSGFLEALAVLTSGRHAQVLHSIASGANFMPRIREATGNAIAEASVVTVLKDLIACGTIARSVHSGPPLQVEYRITESGRALDQLILAARAWTKRFG